MSRKHISQMMRQKIYNKYGGRCAYCGEPITLKNMQIDHIIPVSAKRNNSDKGKAVIESEANYNPSCSMCNLYKANYSVKNFRKELGCLVRRLRKEPIFLMALKYRLVQITQQSIELYFEKKNNAETKEDDNDNEAI